MLVHHGDRLDLVDGLTGPLAPLDLFAEAPFNWQGQRYLSVGAAVAASRFSNPRLRAALAEEPDPAIAWAKGKHLADWVLSATSESVVQERIADTGLDINWATAGQHLAMRAILRTKLTDQRLRELLRTTGNALLIASGEHHQMLWGCCRCSGHASTPGRNLFGSQLMGLRAELGGREDQSWQRATCIGPRPGRITSPDRAWVLTELQRITDKLRTHHGLRVAITSGIPGCDLWWAEIAQSQGIALWLYSAYPQKAQTWDAQDRQLYHATVQSAAYTRVLNPVYSPEAVQAHCRWLLRDSSVLIAVLDSATPSKNTATIVSAARHKRPIVLVDPKTRTTRLLKASAQ
ncbi:SLOG family protein [Crossiella sp. SN42]|uniref:SLOG family protein n=1 Tax=Crossiella sp. SN42 TaxID=2944808 RepID=UPI00207C8DF3|nr:SLOG family protein [Crossiella sp. SN42]MCO1575599.1 SLOG family protein [Crossiella sp. SN42]